MGEDECEMVGMRDTASVRERMMLTMARLRKRWRDMAMVWKRYGGKIYWSRGCKKEEMW